MKSAVQPDFRDAGSLDESSPTPPYHYLGMAMRKAKKLRSELESKLKR